jgi:hypothetical protein
MKLFRLLYNLKFHFDIFTSQVSWFTGKLPELMALLYLLEKFDVLIVGKGILVLGLCVFFSFTIMGFIIKKFGVYEIEQKTNAHNNPVQNEIYNAAIKINKSEKV